MHVDSGLNNEAALTWNTRDGMDRNLLFIITVEKLMPSSLKSTHRTYLDGNFARSKLNSLIYLSR